MEEDLKGQLSRQAAELYEVFFVPALFGEWAPRVATTAQLDAGQDVLDVACGTGVLAREAASRVGSTGSVTGLDRNEGMLAVARRQAPGLEWRLGPAESLPFGDGAFDAVLCQFGLMFFEDRVAALREMWRVLKPRGRLAVAVWGSIGQSPGYAAMAGLLQRLFGERVAAELHAPFTLGDPAALRSLCERAGISGIKLDTVDGTARFPSIEAWVDTDVKGWTLGELLDDAQHDALLRAAGEELRRFATGPGGAVAFPCRAYILSATRS